MSPSYTWTFFFLFGYWVQTLSLHVSTRSNYAEPRSSPSHWYGLLVLIVTALALMPLQLLLSAYMVRRESKPGQTVVLLLFISSGALVVLQLLFANVSWSEEAMIDGTHSFTRTTVYGALALLLIVLSIGVGGYCMCNFDKGLKALHGEPTGVSNALLAGRNGYLMASHRPRPDID